MSNSNASLQAAAIPSMEALRTLWRNIAPSTSGDSQEARSVWAKHPNDPTVPAAAPAAAGLFSSPLKRGAPDSKEYMDRHVLSEPVSVSSATVYDFYRHCTDYGHSYDWPYFRSLRRELAYRNSVDAAPYPPYRPEPSPRYAVPPYGQRSPTNYPMRYEESLQSAGQPPLKRRTLLSPHLSGMNSRLMMPSRYEDEYYTRPYNYGKAPAQASSFQSTMHSNGYTPARPESVPESAGIHGYHPMRQDAGDSPLFSEPTAHTEGYRDFDPLHGKFAPPSSHSYGIEPYDHKAEPRREKPKTRAPTPPPLDFEHAHEYRNEKGERVSMINPRVILDENGISHRSRYFIMLVDNETAISHAKRSSVWSLKQNYANAISEAYKQEANVYFIFINAKSYNALGYAQLTSDVGTVAKPFWADTTYTNGVNVKWIKTCNLYSNEISEIVSRMDHGARARDGQEMMYDEGSRLCTLINSAIMKRIGRDR